MCFVLPSVFFFCSKLMEFALFLFRSRFFVSRLCCSILKMIPCKNQWKKMMNFVFFIHLKQTRGTEQPKQKHMHAHFQLKYFIPMPIWMWQIHNCFFFTSRFFSGQQQIFILNSMRTKKNVCVHIQFSTQCMQSNEMKRIKHNRNFDHLILTLPKTNISVCVCVLVSVCLKFARMQYRFQIVFSSPLSTVFNPKTQSKLNDDVWIAMLDAGAAPIF